MVSRRPQSVKSKRSKNTLDLVAKFHRISSVTKEVRNQLVSDVENLARQKYDLNCLDINMEQVPECHVNITGTLDEHVDAMTVTQPDSSSIAGFSNNTKGAKAKGKLPIRARSNKRLPGTDTFPTKRPEQSIESRNAVELMKPAPRVGESIGVRMDDTVMVKRYLTEKLCQLQQQADKKIAKAWIKGICPKKQARFPYQNTHRKQEEGLDPIVPEWWPKDQGVSYTEPDHINKEQRVKLCLHLLRLRPTPKQLTEWNGGVAEPHKTHVNEGWTAFLRELASKKILDEIPVDSLDKAKQRPKVMDNMYMMAQAEEDYLEGARDAKDMISWNVEMDVDAWMNGTLTSNKRSRPCSPKLDEYPDLESTLEKPTGRKSTKRARKAPIENPAAIQPEIQATQDSRIESNAQQSVPAYAFPSNYLGSLDYKPVFQDDPTRRAYPGYGYAGQEYAFLAPRTSPYPGGSDTSTSVSDGRADSCVNSPQNTSFDSSLSAFSGDARLSAYQPHAAAEQAYFNYAHYGMAHQRQDVNAYRVTEIPQPQFDAVQYMYGIPEVSHQMSVQSACSARHESDSHNATYGATGTRSPHGHYFAGSSTVGSPTEAQQLSYAHAAPHQVYPPTHGLPLPYNQGNVPPQHNGQPFAYAEPRAENNFEAAAPPGSVVRGFTGHGSGVGGGALT